MATDKAHCQAMVFLSSFGSDPCACEAPRCSFAFVVIGFLMTGLRSRPFIAVVRRNSKAILQIRLRPHPADIGSGAIGGGIPFFVCSITHECLRQSFSRRISSKGRSENPALQDTPAFWEAAGKTRRDPVCPMLPEPMGDV
jgi:hypothetical protein